MQSTLLYQIGISLLPGIGDITAKKLIAYCGGVEAVFREKRNNLLKIPGIGELLAGKVVRQEILERAEKEIAFMERYHIQCLFYLDPAYPGRLRHCPDGPVTLFYKGSTPLDAARVISIVGTRSATAYGREVCQSLIAGLSNSNVLVVSGLAYGIDTLAHRSALDNGLDTVGVLAHGLDRIYPSSNKRLAGKMLSHGGLVTDFVSGTGPDRMHFPRRNRIIAGLADAVVVVEAAESGGALITAEIANSYNRDVFAIPGRWGDNYSAGCNMLIKSNKAALIQSADDLKRLMDWDSGPGGRKPVQQELFAGLSLDEELLVKILAENGDCGVDILCLASGLSVSKTAAALLNLEMKGIIRCLPGKRYKLSK